MNEWIQKLQFGYDQAIPQFLDYICDAGLSESTESTEGVEELYAALHIMIEHDDAHAIQVVLNRHEKAIIDFEAKLYNDGAFRQSYSDKYHVGTMTAWGHAVYLVKKNAIPILYTRVELNGCSLTGWVNDWDAIMQT